MKKPCTTECGYTLVEVLVSVGIMLIFLPFAASMLTNSQLLASYSKHKIQAAYAAQQIIETERQNPFLVIAPGNSVTIQPSPASVVLDTKGSYTNVNCATNANLFCGTAIITATPSVYTNGAGATLTSSTVDHFVVSINWTENILNLKVPMTETYAEDIANDPMLN
jgi:type II secretory pathway pseudopilin PulG